MKENTKLDFKSFNLITDLNDITETSVSESVGNLQIIDKIIYYVLCPKMFVWSHILYVALKLK